MTHWTNIRTFMTRQFTVTLDHAYDDTPDLSWADQDTLDKLESGEWGCYLFRVRVTHHGQEIGCDYLGGSIYADPEDFAKEHIGMNAAGRGSYFSDMVRTAIAEARAEMTRSRPYIRAA